MPKSAADWLIARSTEEEGGYEWLAEEIGVSRGSLWNFCSSDGTVSMRPATKKKIWAYVIKTRPRNYHV